MYVTADPLLSEPAIEGRTPVDLTGAVDQFCAGVLIGLLQGQTPTVRMQRGHLPSASVIGWVGTFHVDVPTVLGL